MKVYLFKARFASMVESGEKRQTIRPKRKRGTKIGDMLSLRMWTGKPYRSKQRHLRTAICSGIQEVRIEERPRWSHDPADFAVLLDGMRLHNPIRDDFARLDGFKDGAEMIEWFRDEHGLPFEGDLIRW